MCKNMQNSLDEIDLKIIKSLTEDCRKSTTQIAKEAGTSRPTAIARIKDIAKRNIVDFGAKVNIGKLGFRLALVTLETDETQKRQDIVDKLAACPRVLQIVQVIAKPNYTALICAETPETLLSSIECIRNVLSARIISWQRVKPIIGETFDLKIFLEKCELTPCGKKCAICISYTELDCVGCPATIDYKESRISLPKSQGL
jgi:Lrp/AsnC family leucine-responsive transcriptional regulator